MSENRVQWFSGLEVLTEDMGHDQTGRQAQDRVRVSDYWRHGILKDPSGLSNFTLSVDGTTATLINIGHGTAYAQGFRISISADKTYDANAPFATTNGICTPQSSGNRGIPLANYTAGQSNFIWAEYLETLRTNPTAVSLVDGVRHYHHTDDGYRIVINTTNPPGNTTGISNAVFLGTVFGQGASTALTAAPNGICQLQQQFTSLIPTDTIGTANLQDASVTPQKLSNTFGNFTINQACFTTLVASSRADVPTHPLLPTSAASKRFAQKTGWGMALSKTVFRPTYDGNFNVISVSVEGDLTGTITPSYDSLCQITQLTEVIDTQTVYHTLTYSTVNGSSTITAIQEQGV